jgi:hypothetical protein
MSVGLPTIFSVPDWQRLRAATLAILFVGTEDFSRGGEVVAAFIGCEEVARTAPPIDVRHLSMIIV